MALPKTGITTSLVGNTLGTSVRNVGALCTSTLINMWSRCKPVRIASASPNRAMPSNGLNAWWKGDNDDCGISVPVVSGYTQIPGMYTTDKTNGYKYSRPTGGSNSPYRLADFMLYDHYAKPPLSGFVCSDMVPPQGYIECSVNFNIKETDKSGAGSLGLEDIHVDAGADLANWYIGALIVDSGGGILKWQADVTTGRTLRISSNGLVQGKTYSVVPFLCKNSIAANAVVGANSYIPLPNCAPGSCKITSSQEASGINVFLSGEYVYDLSNTKYAVDWRIRIEYTGKDPSVILRNNKLSLRFRGKDPNSSYEAGELTNDPGVITVNRGTTYELTGRFVLRNTMRQYYLYLTLDTSRYTERADLFEMNLPMP